MRLFPRTARSSVEPGARGREQGVDLDKLDPNVAIADDHDAVCRAVELMSGVVGMAVVPPDEVKRGVTTRNYANRIVHRVVMRDHFVVGEILAGRMQSTGHTGTQLASLQQFCVIT